ncbi:MAG: polysaccharide biosynthesis tyrosine autokinase [Planctomycetaceae bacterium]
MDHDTQTVVVSSSSETMDVLAGLLRFGKSLRNRQGVLITYVLAASVIGGAYYVAADRVYQSDGDLMVLPTGADVMDAKTGKPHIIDHDMPTYERMVKCDPVIRATIRALPHEHRRDLLGIQPGNWERCFRQRVSVSTAKDTNIMSVAYRSSDPETAYAVLSTLFTKYVAYVNGIYVRDSDNRLTILRADRASIEEQIAEKQRRFSQLLKESSLVLGPENEQSNPYADRMKSLNNDLIEAGKNRRQADVLLRSLERAIENGENLQQFSLAMAGNAGIDLFKNEIGTVDGYAVRKLRDSILEDETKLQNMLNVEGYGPQHSAVKELQARIENRQAELRNLPTIIKEAANAVAQTELAPKLLRMALQSYEIAAENEREIQLRYAAESEQASQLNNQLVEFRQVKQQLETLRVRLDSVLDTMSTIMLGQKHGLFTEITRDPQIVRTPVAPRLALVVVVSLFLGFTAACATVYILDLLDDRFHTPDDLRQQIGAPILAMVRRLPPLGAHGMESLHTFSRPNSPESEAFRTLRAALDFTGGGARRLTISSTEPSDGKTTIIANLSVAFAQSGKRTLLIDGDMRRPGLTRLFERGGHPGLSTVLRDTRPVVDVVPGMIVKTEHEKLHVLLAGPRPGNPVELLTSDRLSELIAWAETAYDQILIDAPPSLAVTDAAIIGRLVDGAILTVRPDKNRRKLVLRAAEALTSLGCELLGVVINSVQPRTDHEYGYGSGYGHGSYGHGDIDGEEIESPSEDAVPTTAAETGSTLGVNRDRTARHTRKRRAA